MSTVQNISPFGAGPVTVPGITNTGSLSVAGPTTLNGTTTINSQLTIPSSASNGYVLTSNASGVATWAPASGGFPALTTINTTASGPWSPATAVVIKLTKSGQAVIGSVGNFGAAQSAASTITVGPFTVPSSSYFPSANYGGTLGCNFPVITTDNSANAFSWAFFEYSGGNQMQIFISTIASAPFSGTGTLSVSSFTFSYVTDS